MILCKGDNEFESPNSGSLHKSWLSIQMETLRFVVSSTKACWSNTTQSMSVEPSLPLDEFVLCVKLCDDPLLAAAVALKHTCRQQRLAGVQSREWVSPALEVEKPKSPASSTEFCSQLPTPMCSTSPLVLQLRCLQFRSAFCEDGLTHCAPAA